MLKNLKMSAKLVAVLIAPVLVLVVLAYIGINERQSQADEASGIARLTEMADASSALSHQLQLEAILSVTSMEADGSQSDIVEALKAQRAQVDAAAKTFIDAANRAPIDVDTVQGGDLDSALDSARNRVDGLGVIRQSVDEVQVATKSTRGNYSESVLALLTVNDRVAKNVKNPVLANQLRDLVLLGSYKSSSAEIGSLLATVTEVGSAEASEIDELEGLIAERTRRQQQFTELASADNKALLRNNTSGESEVNKSIQEVLTVAPGAKLPVTNAAWRETAVVHLEGLFEVEAKITAETLGDANSLRSDAEGERNLFLLGTLAAVAFALSIALLVSRATTRPLQKLTDAAYELSNEKLPGLVDQLRNPQAGGEGHLRLQLDAIEIDSRDEVGLLAEAFNAIQQVTIDVAEEQAALLRKGIGDIFVNLARRNQNILDRQIEFIDMLEAKEENPDQLDNLFKLDHLATRMRRNAESLLVLAGAEPPRRRGRPVELADVIRVAIGEVEDFARISLVALDEVAVDGNVAVDLAHLLSEFMENATHFSPPDTQVEVLGRWSRDSDGATNYTIAVTDQGIGMSAEQMAEANHLLAHPPLVGLALSRSLGFIVIARLAERLKISVTLESAPTGGVVALVVLPGAMMKVEGEEAPSVLDDAPMPEAEPAAPEDASTINIEPYEPVAYEEPPAAVEEEPVYEEPPAAVEQESAYDEQALSELPTDDDFDRGLADLLSEEESLLEELEPVTEPIEAEPVEEVIEESEPFLDELPTPTADESSLPTRDAADLPARDDLADLAEPEPEPELAVDEGLPLRDTAGLADLPTREPEPELEPEPVAVAPSAEAPAAAATTTTAGLVRRTPKKKKEGAGTQSLISGGLPTAGGARKSTAATKRSPEEVRKMLSRYRSGVRKDTSAAESKGESE